MRIIIKCIVCIYASALLIGCGVTGTTSKYNFNDGYYYSKLSGNKKKKYFIVSGSDSIKVYPADIAKQIADTMKSITVLFPANKKPSNFSTYSFTSQSFDLDVITILFKYRPPVKDFPAQFNTNFNGAFYAGFRTDKYDLNYANTPLHVAKRKISHRGFSVGGFAGIGSARIDEFVTLNRIDYEYDGAVFTTGVATELGFNNINFGIECGLDFLTDRNSHVWVSEKKPWVGLSIGINLN